MTDEQFRAFLDLMMCSDPWPIIDTPHGMGDGKAVLEELARDESKKRGFVDWIAAYHEFGK